MSGEPQPVCVPQDTSPTHPSSLSPRFPSPEHAPLESELMRKLPPLTLPATFLQHHGHGQGPVPLSSYFRATVSVTWLTNAFSSKVSVSLNSQVLSLWKMFWLGAVFPQLLPDYPLGHADWYEPI